MSLSYDNFIKLLNTKYSFEKNPYIAVAVSGGPDSMALLFLLNSWIKLKKGKIIALIVDHKLRNNSRNECKQISKTLFNNKINNKVLSVNRIKLKKKNMLEARNNRYQVLTNYCKKNYILHLFVAHHFDDSLETFLERKLFGSDILGLGGIQDLVIKNKIVIRRPFLNFYKKDIYKFNKINKIEFIEDPSNANLKFTRSNVRSFLKNIEPNVKKEIKDEFSMIKKNLILYKYMTNELFFNVVIQINMDSIKVDLNKFKKIDNLLSERITKLIYSFFYPGEISPRSKKIQIFLTNLKLKKFRLFNLKGLNAKKTNDSVLFERILTK